MEREDKSLEPYVHADSLTEWLDGNGFEFAALRLRQQIFQSFAEYGSIADQL